MHGVIRSNGPLGRQLGWNGNSSDLDVVSAAEYRRRHVERERIRQEQELAREREEQWRRVVEEHVRERARLAEENAQLAEENAELAATLARQNHWRMDDLIRHACDAFGAARRDILSERRNWHIIRPRHAAMWLCKRFTEQSFPQVGHKFGGRDHTTVLHAVHKVEAIIANEGIDGGDSPQHWAELLAALPADAWKVRP